MKRCGCSNIIKHGLRKNKYKPKQIYKCNNCDYYFTKTNKFGNSLYKEDLVNKALQQFCLGKSYEVISQNLNETNGTSLSKSTIYRWVNKVKKQKWQI